MNFKAEYERRLRRVCGVTDDTLNVTEDSETRYGGGCNTCAYEYTVIVVTVFSGDKDYSTAKTTVATMEFSGMGKLMRALTEIKDEDEDD